MINIVGLFLAYTGLIMWYRTFKSKNIGLGFVLIFIYTLVSFLGIIFYLDDKNIYNIYRGNISFLPYVYLFFISILFFRPFLNNNQILLERVVVRKTRLLYYFSLIYILFSIISLFYQTTNVISLLAEGDWFSLRTSLYYDDDFKLYDTQLERFVRIITTNSRLLAILVYFYFLTDLKKRRRTVFNILFLFSILLPSIFTSIETAARGSLIFLFINFLTGYLVFRSKIPNAAKLKLKYFSLTLLIILSTYVTAVTISRFGTDNQSSMLFYISHSFMTFNYGVFDTIVNFANGNYFFNFFLSNPEINFNYLGTHFETKFITFIGTLYLDFGPIGTFLISLIIPYFILLNKRKPIYFSNLYLYSFYFNYLVSGVFVIGKGNVLSWIIALLILFTLKIFKV